MFSVIKKGLSNLPKLGRNVNTMIKKTMDIKNIIQQAQEMIKENKYIEGLEIIKQHLKHLPSPINKIKESDINKIIEKIKELQKQNKTIDIKIILEDILVKQQKILTNNEFNNLYSFLKSYQTGGNIKNLALLK